MQKKLIALAIAGMAAAPVFAQSSVKIYGRLDIGLNTNSTDDAGLKVDGISSNRWGFQGEEDLGGGLSAFFRLEQRFYLANGNELSASTTTSSNNGNSVWTDKAWVGLEYAPVGALSMGRVLTVGNTIMGGGDFEALTDTLATVNSRNGSKRNQVNNGIKFESAWFGPVAFVAHTATTEAAQGGITPYGVGMRVKAGKFKSDFFFQKDTTSDAAGPVGDRDKDVAATYPYGNMMYTFGIGAAYDFGFMKLKQVYANSHGYSANDGQVNASGPGARLRSWSTSINVPMGKGEWGFAYNKVQERANDTFKPQKTKLIAGYSLNLSKRTKIIATTAYERQTDALGKSYTGGGKPRSHSWVNALGMRHEF